MILIIIQLIMVLSYRYLKKRRLLRDQQEIALVDRPRVPQQPRENNIANQVVREEDLGEQLAAISQIQDES
jgi:hypothetical protein